MVETRTEIITVSIHPAGKSKRNRYEISAPLLFVRVHPAEDYRLDTAIIEIKDDREVYLVAPGMRVELFAETKPVRLFTTISRQGVVALWPCKLPGADGRPNSWHDTALKAAELAMTRWTRIVPDMGLGGYQPYTAAGDLPEPEWPEQSAYAKNQQEDLSQADKNDFRTLVKRLAEAYGSPRHVEHR